MINTFSMKLVYDVVVTGSHFGDILWLGRKRGEPRVTAAASHIQAAVDQIVLKPNTSPESWTERPVAGKWETPSQRLC